jgi:TRAP-type uncharacterized transport system substrate-binding protein
MLTVLSTSPANVLGGTISWIKASKNTNFSLSMTASTGSARNLQQVQIDQFTYTETATAQVHYVDADTGKEIVPPKTLAGDVDNKQS